MAHFTTRPNLTFAVKMQMGIGAAEKVFPAHHLRTNEITHLGPGVTPRRSKRPTTDRTDMLFELGGRGGVERPMPRIVNARRDLIHDEVDSARRGRNGEHFNRKH